MESISQLELKAVSADQKYKDENKESVYISLDNFDAVLEAIEHETRYKRVIVLVAGSTRSGKSDLASYGHSKLQESGIKSQIVHLNQWILGVDKRMPGMNVLDLFQSHKMNLDFQKLFNDETVTLDAYDGRTRGMERLRKEIVLSREGVIWIEGVVAFSIDSLVENCDLKLFITIDDKVRHDDLHIVHEALRQADIVLVPKK